MLQVIYENKKSKISKSIKLCTYISGVKDKCLPVKQNKSVSKPNLNVIPYGKIVLF